MSTCRPSCPPDHMCMRRYARICAEGLPAKMFCDLIGKRYERDGVGPDAYDCLGLVIEVSRRRGFHLPDYQSSAEEFYRNHDEAKGILGPCQRIERAAPGAVVLMRSPGDPADRHLGVMVDRHRMLHASEQAGSVVLESLWHSFWGRRVLGYYELEVRA